MVTYYIEWVPTSWTDGYTLWPIMVADASPMKIESWLKKNEQKEVKWLYLFTKLPYT